MVVTDNEDYAACARLFRNHGIDLSANERAQKVTWEYRMTELGNNYRLTDLHSALGRTQLQKLPGWLRRRQEIAETYDGLFAKTPQVRPLDKQANLKHAYHLYVVSVGEGEDPEEIRRATFLHMRSCGIGVNVHYLPVHLHPYYQRSLGTRPGLCPVAERAYQSILSLPMFPGLTDADVNRISETLLEAL
jgi:perosamine synthetase